MQSGLVNTLLSTNNYPLTKITPQGIYKLIPVFLWTAKIIEPTNCLFLLPNIYFYG